MNGVYLIITASDESATDGTLDRFLVSAMAALPARVICVARGWRPETASEIETRYGLTRLTLIEAEANLPLSQARNIALRQLAKLAPEQGSVVAFPDDDCWYLPNTLASVEAAFSERPDAAAVVGCYGPGPGLVNRDRFPLKIEDLTARKAATRVSSVTLFVRAEHVIAARGFNTALGAGSELIAGEDVDYVLGLIEQGLAVHYRPDIVIGHPYKESAGASYAGPFLLVLASHLPRSPALMLLLLRGAVSSVKHRVEGRSRVHALQFLRPRLIRHVMRSRPQIESVNEPWPTQT